MRVMILLSFISEALVHTCAGRGVGGERKEFVQKRGDMGGGFGRGLISI